MLANPFTLPVGLPEPCQYALKAHGKWPRDIVATRLHAIRLDSRLEHLCWQESREVQSLVHKWLCPIVMQRNVACMRELSFIRYHFDMNFLPHHLM